MHTKWYGILFIRVVLHIWVANDWVGLSIIWMDICGWTEKRSCPWGIHGPRGPCLRHHFFQRPTVHRMSTGQRGQHALKSCQSVQICTTMLKSSAWHCAAFFSSSRSLNFCCALTCAIGAVLEQSSHEHTSNSAWQEILGCLREANENQISSTNTGLLDSGNE